jgi:ATP-dependent Clp protease ATP-binding subunit ClpC
MNLAIPIYIEEHKVAGDPTPQFRLRPLFFEQPLKAARQLAMGMSKLAQAMRQRLDALATQPRQEEMIPWTFSPALSEARVKFSLQLRRQTVDCRVLVASFSALDRRIAFVPALGDVYFEVLRGQDLEQRARDVIGEHFRRLEKEEGEAFELPARLASCSRAWITPLELDVHPKPSLEKAPEGNLMAILSSQKPDGRFELTRVGRCLDWLYPDELDRAVMREEEVGELLRLLAEPDRRPLLLWGRERWARRRSCTRRFIAARRSGNNRTWRGRTCGCCRRRG